MDKDFERHEPNGTDHVEAALSEAAQRAHLTLSDKQWCVFCVTARRELQDRGIVRADRSKRNG